MDHKTRPFEIYIATFTNISNEDNDDITNGQEQWGEGGAMNITTTLQELETLEANEHEQ